MTICPTCGGEIPQKPKGATKWKHDECAEFEYRKAQLATAAGKITTWGTRHHLWRERGNMFLIVNQNLHYSKGRNLPEGQPIPKKKSRKAAAQLPANNASEGSVQEKDGTMTGEALSSPENAI